MPCEGCHVQFTVFRRKRSCQDCKRFYCSNCLSASKRSSSISLCERCTIFAKRPLLRTDLLQLKPKDLIFYLQSQHISTTGCVEKDELVRLVLNHAQQADTLRTPRNRVNSPSSEADASNSFEGLKQSCQNFFSNITDNISDSFASFDGKNGTKSPQDHNPRQTTTTHIFDQPRVSTREIPSYASFQTNRPGAADASNVPRPPTTTPQAGPSRSTSPSAANSPSSETTSPVVSLNSATTSQPAAVTAALNCEERLEHLRKAAVSGAVDVNVHHEEESKSDCACSDDDDEDEELITTFSERERLSAQTVDSAKTANQAAVAGPSTSSKMDLCDADASSQSSFEELGAIGGISDDSKAATDTNSSNIDQQWQILDSQRAAIATVGEEEGENLQVALVHSPQPDRPPPPIVPQRTKKVTRRRSDGYLNRQRPTSDDDSPTGVYLPQADNTVADSNETPNSRTNCKRCGKNKSNIRRQVEKMRSHLESAQMSESDIKEELQHFLAFLEQRTKSIDSDSETAVSSFSAHNYGQASSSPYAGVAASCNGNGTRRFINLDDFDSLKDLEYLSVKQLKEVLMLNRVDYKGCCEKQELLERVERLWTHLKSAPTTEKLHTDELCKICMDAPIECVILECGHMATCTSCGKVLSECPICRQYIVRVVRFFRA